VGVPTPLIHAFGTDYTLPAWGTASFAEY